MNWSRSIANKTLPKKKNQLSQYCQSAVKQTSKMRIENDYILFFWGSTLSYLQPLCQTMANLTCSQLDRFSKILMG